MVLQIVQYGEKVLLEKGRPVADFGPALKKLYRDMLDTMRDAEGIGLAAQQVGLALQFCVMDLSQCEPDFKYELDGAAPPLDFFMPLGMCNPTVTPLTDHTALAEEGCLSFPDIRGDVERPEWIRCEYQDIDGAAHVIECDGLLARCIQHEVDHLNGILFTERMPKRVYKRLQAPIIQLKARTLQRAKRIGGAA